MNFTRALFKAATLTLLLSSLAAAQTNEDSIETNAAVTSETNAAAISETNAAAISETNAAAISETNAVAISETNATVISETNAEQNTGSNTNTNTVAVKTEFEKAQTESLLSYDKIDHDYKFDLESSSILNEPAYIVEDYNPNKVKEISAFRRAESLYFIAIPFASIYTFFSIRTIDTGLFFGMGIPVLRNDLNYERPGKLFAFFTAALWAFAITRDDMQRIKNNERITERESVFNLEPKIKYDVSKSGTRDFGVGLDIKYKFK